jgi:TRAP transporter 4TM/12TM fusion protein
VTAVLAVVLVAFTAAEVNYPRLGPHAQLAIFATLGLLLAFHLKPAHPRLAAHPLGRWLDRVLMGLALLVGVYLVAQSEPAGRGWWTGGQSLGDRAGIESGLDIAIGVLGLLLILEATRRSVGWALPMLAVAFLVYSQVGPSLPDFLFPHRGYSASRVVAQTFLHSQGVFGTALRVMFVYVFLFVAFGALLEGTGASAYVIDRARRLFGRSPGGPAKVAVLASGLMGSLSGSAVANTATTGTFTIPLMMRTGFRPHIAAGIEAAASSGGALVPPVMGAGAYMMLELIDPAVTYLQIIRAALLPAVLYYLSLFTVVHLLAKRASNGGQATGTESPRDGVGEIDLAGDDSPAPGRLEGVIFVGALSALLALLFVGFTVFRAVSLAMVVVIALGALSPRTRVGPRKLIQACVKTAQAGIALIVAASCVGVVLGVVTLTGIGSKLPATILPLAADNLFLALLLLMVSSIVLGMGLPSAVCYLLLATLIGPALGGMGVPPLAAHLFIFYFGLMSMVTPPVALAAYTAASIAGSNIMRTAFSAFRFALVGFVLPFLFVYRPALLLLGADSGPAAAGDVIIAVVSAALGIGALASAVVGQARKPLGVAERLILLAASIALFVPETTMAIAGTSMTWIDVGATIVLVSVTARRPRAQPQ